MMLFGVERAEAYALVVSAKNEKKEVATIGQKSRVDVIRFIVGSVRFRNCYRRAPTAGTRYNTPSSSARTRLCRRGSRWPPRDLLLHRSFRLASSGINLFQLGMGIKTDQIAIGDQKGESASSGSGVALVLPANLNVAPIGITDRYG